MYNIVYDGNRNPRKEKQERERKIKRDNMVRRDIKKHSMWHISNNDKPANRKGILTERALAHLRRNGDMVPNFRERIP